MSSGLLAPNPADSEDWEQGGKGAAVGAMTGILINVGDYNTDEPNTLAVSAEGAVSGAALGGG